jgi:hypothetical protein
LPEAADTVVSFYAISFGAGGILKMIASKKDQKPEKSQIVQQAIADWGKLPSGNRRFKQDAWAFVSTNLSKYEGYGVGGKELALRIIRYQDRINEPLAGR